MNQTIIGILGIIVMILLFLTRMPVAYVMALVGWVGFSMVTSWKAGLTILARNIWETFASYGLTTIPLFVLMGQIAFASGINKRLYETAYKFLGAIRGGLAIATVSACTAFGAICGSSPATAATMATVGLPEMKRYGYESDLAAGSVASGGGLGMIMPPSIVLIVYGILTEQSIGKLFNAGIVPAIILTILFAITIYIVCTLYPNKGPKGASCSWKERFISIKNLLEVLVVFLAVILGMSFGVFTPTEAASVGVLGVILVSVIQRNLTWSKFVQAVYDTLSTSAMIMMLVAGAVVFGKFLAVTRIPFNLAHWIMGFDLPRELILMLVVFIYFLGGCFMDSLAFVMLTIPIFFPLVVTHLGYDPIWFGILIVMVTEMGVITPPVGINVYVVYGVTRNLGMDIKLETIFRGILPFVIAVIAGILLFVAFPGIVTFLPSLMD